jgi:nicotinamide-nucleotide amidase
MDPELLALGAEAGALLKERGDTIAVCESSAGGLVSAALLAVPGASAYFLGGTVVYTRQASKALLAGVVEVPAGLRGATEDYAAYQARSVRGKLDATWGTGEAGAAGPAQNSYGDPNGHTWVAVAGAGDVLRTRHVLTGSEDRAANMVAFAGALLTEIVTALRAAG